MKALILAGGGGTRLWPLSREEKPKQFHQFISSHTLLQETIERLKFLSPKDIYIASNQKYIPLVKKQARLIPANNIIVEPALRDTASCIALAATIIQKRTSPDEIMCVIYADHLIKDKREFEKKLNYAAFISEQEETITIIEVKAKYPNPNLGYVKIGKLLRHDERGDVYTLEKFVEKPTQAAAQKMMESYKYLWNTGLYVWKVKTILALLQKHLPQTWHHLEKIRNSLGSPEESEIIKSEYPKFQKISIDYAVMEKLDPELVRIIQADLGWCDIGTWDAIHKERSKRPKDTVGKGKYYALDSKGSVIYNFDKRLIAAIGLKDMIVVNTDDAILICPKDRSQDVKKLVEILKKKGLTR